MRLPQKIVSYLYKLLYKKLLGQAAVAKFVVLELKKEIKKSMWPLVVWFSYFFISWGLMIVFEPEGSAITTLVGYVYFVSALATTVGLGDVSAVTTVGMIVTTFSYYFFPGFLGAYGILLFRDIKKIYEKVITGDIIVDIKNHILIISFQKERTAIIVDNVLADKRRENRPLLLCFDAEKYNRNPMRGKISGLSTKTGFKSDKFLRDARVTRAARILIDTGRDDLNNSLCVIMRGMNPTAHIVVAFDSMRDNLSVMKYVPGNIECAPTSLPEFIARCLQDPGSSRTTLDTMDADGQTKYGLQIPSDFKGCTVDQLRSHLLGKRALVVSAGESRWSLILNPPGTRRVEGGTFIEYYRTKRLKKDMIDWNRLAELSK